MQVIYCEVRVLGALPECDLERKTPNSERTKKNKKTKPVTNFPSLRSWIIRIVFPALYRPRMKLDSECAWRKRKKRGEAAEITARTECMILRAAAPSSARQVGSQRSCVCRRRSSRSCSGTIDRPGVASAGS